MQTHSSDTQPTYNSNPPENQGANDVTASRDKIAELEQRVFELTAENAVLRRQLAASRDKQIDPNSLTVQAKKILSWLSKRDPESLLAISFALSLNKASANVYVLELMNLGLVEQSPKASQVEKWQISPLGRQYLST
jgi:hypothetical protein